MVFSKKWLRNHPNFLMTFSDTYLCCVASLSSISTSIFQVTAILKNAKILKNFNIIIVYCIVFIGLLLQVFHPLLHVGLL